MRIGVIGAGRMGGALATRWVQAGHELVIAGRTPEKAAALAHSIGADARHGTLREAAEFGEVVLVAVKREGVLGALLEAGAAEGVFVGKTIVDCNNFVETQTFTPLGGGGPSLAEQISSVAHGASVVKAFHLCHYKVWELEPPVFDGRPLTVPICGNEPAAKAQVGELIEALGCRALDIGPLHRARALEAMAAVMIGLLFSGAPPTTVFNLVDAGEHAVAAAA